MKDREPRTQTSEMIQEISSTLRTKGCVGTAKVIEEWWERVVFCPEITAKSDLKKK